MTLQEYFTADPIKGLALGAALIAFASTPIAFAILGRLDWFAARRGRINLKPTFVSIITGMLLVMGIPAIFAALVIKSDRFDANRYAYDPNHTWSVIDQGRSYNDLKSLNDALVAQAKSLAEKEKNLVNGVKKLDESMITLRNASVGSPAVAQTMPGVLNSLAGVRQSVGLDGPQQLIDFTAPPAAIANGPRASVVPPGTMIASAAPVAPVAPAPVPVAAAPTTPAPAAAPGALAPATAEAEIASVPAPQKKIAKMLPLVDLPKGWVVGKSGEKHLETFNAENLFEKIDGRAESFVQYSVVGMAYTYFHPAGDESNEVQIYIFEMADSLKALGKYGSEKPDDAKLIPVGTEGYTAAGSTLFHAGPYYTQIVSTRDDKAFSDFALEIARKVAAQQKPAEAVAGSQKFSTADTLFKLLPEKSGKTAPKYVAEDVFAFSFLTDVFMADYKDGKDTWLGFIRPYQTPEAAREVLEKYAKTVKQDGAKTSEAKYEGADQVLISENIGLVDVVFRKGNSVGGINGATEKAKAEAFVKEMVKAIPATLPPLESDSKPKAKADGGGGEGEK